MFTSSLRLTDLSPSASEALHYGINVCIIIIIIIIIIIVWRNSNVEIIESKRREFTQSDYKIYIWLKRPHSRPKHPDRNILGRIVTMAEMSNIFLFYGCWFIH